MGDSDRVVVQTYVPRHQKEAWKRAAAALDMSQSEFVRSMVQAGRRGFESTVEEPPLEDATPRGQSLEDRVLDMLYGGGLSWADLDDALDVSESDLDDAIDALREAGSIEQTNRGEFVRTDR